MVRTFCDRCGAPADVFKGGLTVAVEDTSEWNAVNAAADTARAIAPLARTPVDAALRCTLFVPVLDAAPDLCADCADDLLRLALDTRQQTRVLARVQAEAEVARLRAQGQHAQADQIARRVAVVPAIPGDVAVRPEVAL